MMATVGNIRMRVLLYSGDGSYPPNTCGGYFRGETVDYFMNIIPSFPINTTIQNITIANGHDTCFNALQTITVAGGGTTFIVQDGGSTTMIAGQKINFLPGSKVNPGGYLHGYITQDGSWCNTPAMPGLMTNGGDEKNLAIGSKADGFAGHGTGDPVGKDP
jgi:hypothetical protein